MESDAMHHAVVSDRARAASRLILGASLCFLSAGPALAQAGAGRRVELAGSWTPTNQEWVSNDSVPVDYVGLPLNDAGRIRALSYSESQLGMLERQCEGWSASYILTGPFGMKISTQYEPVKDNVVSYTIAAWEDKLPLVIWMRCPIGSSPGKNLRAKVSLISATRPAPSRSCSVKPRPRRTGVPKARR